MADGEVEPVAGDPWESRDIPAAVSRSWIFVLERVHRGWLAGARQVHSAGRGELRERPNQLVAGSPGAVLRELVGGEAGDKGRFRPRPTEGDVEPVQAILAEQWTPDVAEPTVAAGAAASRKGDRIALVALTRPMFLKKYGSSSWSLNRAASWPRSGAPSREAKTAFSTRSAWSRPIAITPSRLAGSGWGISGGS